MYIYTQALVRVYRYVYIYTTEVHIVSLPKYMMTRIKMLIMIATICIAVMLIVTRPTTRIILLPRTLAVLIVRAIPIVTTVAVTMPGRRNIRSTTSLLMGNEGYISSTVCRLVSPSNPFMSQQLLQHTRGKSLGFVSFFFFFLAGGGG